MGPVDQYEEGEERARAAQRAAQVLGPEKVVRDLLGGRGYLGRLARTVAAFHTSDGSERRNRKRCALTGL